MEKDEILNLITEIGTLENDVERRTKLTSLSDEVTKLFETNETNQTTINTLNETITKNNSDIEDLRQANMQLFLRVGEQKTPQQVQEDSTGVKNPESNKRKFEDLFKEGGN